MTHATSHLDQLSVNTTISMEPHLYSMPQGVHAIPADELDLRSDAEVDAVLLQPLPPSSSSEKNIWLFWHSGYSTMHPYTQRTVRTYHRRFSKKGWTVRVVDRAPNSPCNVANFLDLHDPDTFPQAFRDGTITGTYALQHTSDLVRWPLLLKYGGVYVDVGLMPIGDLDRLWDATVGDPGSRWEILSNNAGPPDDYDLTNYLLCARRNNPVFQRCHRLLLALWAEDGGKTSTEGMHKSSLLRGLPLLGRNLSDQDSQDLTDYIIQGQVMRMVLSSVDEEDGWDGPGYVTKHIYALEYMVGSQLINEMTAWDGAKAFELMSLKLPGPGETETNDQKLAREIVEACLSRSFSFKLAHGMIIRVLGETLGSLWRAHPGSDDITGTYAHWLRYGMLNWSPDELPEPMEFVRIAPVKTGPLFRAD